MSKYKKYTIKAGSLLILGLFLYFQGYHTIFGVETAHADISSQLEDVCTNGLAGMMSCIIPAAGVLTWIIFTMLILLIDPAVIFEIGNTTGPPTGNLLSMLNIIWILSRDLMNVIFAVVLIVVAIYIVVTAKKEFVVSFFPKFVLAVVLVNFSWFFSFVILDAANVLATTIYDIPQLVYTADPLFCKHDPATDTNVTVPYDAVTNVYFFPDTEDINSPMLGGTPAAGWNCDFQPLLCYQTGPLPVGTAAGHSVILNGLIMNHAHLQQLGIVPDKFKGPDAFSESLVFVVRQALVLVIIISLLFPLLAMAAAFLIRIPVLWLTIAFMPFAFLAFVGGDKLKEWTGTEGPKAIWDTFLKFAFLPALIAVPLAIGFIMVNVGSQLACTGGGAIAQALDDINLDFISSIGSPYQLLWLIMVEIILWVGVFTVLKGIPIVGRVSESIRQQGVAFGKIAATLPLTIPTLPMAGGISPFSLAQKLKPTALWGAISGARNLDEFKEAFAGRQPADKADTGQIRATADGIRGDKAGSQTHLEDALKKDKKIQDIIDAIHMANVDQRVTNLNLIDTLRRLKEELGSSRADKIGLTDAAIKKVSDRIKTESGSGGSAGATTPATPPAGGGSTPPASGASPAAGSTP